MMNKYLLSLEKQFVTEGGIKERMFAARTGYRKAQNEERQKLILENQTLRFELEQAQAEIARLREQLKSHQPPA